MDHTVASSDGHPLGVGGPANARDFLHRINWLLYVSEVLNLHRFLLNSNYSFVEVRSDRRYELFKPLPIKYPI